jgi:hypothetical protein
MESTCRRSCAQVSAAQEVADGVLRLPASGADGAEYCVLARVQLQRLKPITKPCVDRVAHAGQQECHRPVGSRPGTRRRYDPTGGTLTAPTRHLDISSRGAAADGRPCGRHSDGTKRERHRRPPRVATGSDDLPLTHAAPPAAYLNRRGLGVMVSRNHHSGGGVSADSIFKPFRRAVGTMPGRHVERGGRHGCPRDCRWGRSWIEARRSTRWLTLRNPVT